ncbi:MAG: hypothetical protein A4E54_00064 [Pelotomaculum sp. PtaB.Bin117]|nr:MAG: hypothetical protein A4E54_00064 [Pelotomaculum sp. PtaB.Bin117]
MAAGQAGVEFFTEFRHEQVNVPSEDIPAPVAEDTFRGRIKRLNDTARVDGNDTVKRMVHQRPVERLALLKRSLGVPGIHHPPHAMTQNRPLNRFRYIVGSPRFESHVNVFIIIQLGNHDYRYAISAGELLQPGAGGKTIHYRHHAVHQNNLRPVMSKGGQRLHPVLRVNNIIAIVFQNLTQFKPHIFRVVHHENQGILYCCFIVHFYLFGDTILPMSSTVRLRVVTMTL